MLRKPKTNGFNWNLFDAQPLVVKQGTWEHNIYPDFPVDHEDAKAIARMMFGDAGKVDRCAAKECVST